VNRSSQNSFVPLVKPVRNRIYKFATMAYYYYYHNSTHYQSPASFILSRIAIFISIQQSHKPIENVLSCIKKHSVSEAGFYLRLEVEPTQFGPTERIFSLSLSLSLLSLCAETRRRGLNSVFESFKM
jgi:hypothetical protein